MAKASKVKPSKSKAKPIKPASNSCIPSLIVFDLDYTLWPFYVDTHVTPPFTKLANESVVDSTGARIKPYEGAEEILKSVHKQGIKIGVASRSHAPEAAKQLVELLGWTKYITYIQIFGGWKIPHFQTMQKESGVDFSQMLFFDDEERNIRDVRTLGVFCVIVPEGITIQLFDDSMKAFEQHCKSSSSKSVPSKGSSSKGS